jgi:hypothetical protein
MYAIIKNYKYKFKYSRKKLLCKLILTKYKRYTSCLGVLNKNIFFINFTQILFFIKKNLKFKNLKISHNLNNFKLKIIFVLALFRLLYYFSLSFLIKKKLIIFFLKNFSKLNYSKKKLKNKYINFYFIKRWHI